MTNVLRRTTPHQNHPSKRSSLYEPHSYIPVMSPNTDDMVSTLKPSYNNFRDGANTLKFIRPSVDDSSSRQSLRTSFQSAYQSNLESDIKSPQQQINCVQQSNHQTSCVYSSPIKKTPTVIQHRQQHQHQQKLYQQQTPQHPTHQGAPQNNTSKFQRLIQSRSSCRSKPAKPSSNAIVSTIKSADVNLLNQLLHCSDSANNTDEDNVPVLFLTLENSAKPDMLKVLLEHGADPNARHPIIHKTCLHVAAKRGYHLCARILLAAGADSEAKDFRGNSALMYALKFGHPSVAKVILQGSAKLNTSFENYVNNKGETLLHVAIEGGDMECVKLALVATPTCLRENVDENGRTPLFVACKLNRPSLAELLIDSTEHFYNIDAQDKETGKTALHYAVENKNILLVEHLLKLGANPNARNNNWETPFLSAVKQGLDADMLLLFVDFQCDVMASDRYFNTALHYAASEGISHLIPFLAELGLNPNCKGDCGLSPLMIAAFRNYLECAEELLKCGADPDLLDRNSATALVYSILGSSNRSPDNKNNAEVSNANQLETIKLLLRYGVDMDKPTSIHKICTCYKLELVYPLSKLAENRLYTPLEIAYLKGNQEIFNLLIRAGCELHSFKLEFIENEMYDQNRNSEHRVFHNMVKTLRERRFTVKTLVEISRKAALSHCKKNLKKEIIHFSTYDEFCNKRLIYLLNYNDLNETQMPQTNQSKIPTLTNNLSSNSLVSMSNTFRKTNDQDRYYPKKQLQYSNSRQSLVFKKVETSTKLSPGDSGNSSTQNSKTPSPSGSNSKISNHSSCRNVEDEDNYSFKRSNSFKNSQNISKVSPSHPNPSPLGANFRLYSSMRINRVKSSPVENKTAAGKSPAPATRLNSIPEQSGRTKSKLIKTFSSPEKPKKKEPVMQNFLLR